MAARPLHRRVVTCLAVVSALSLAGCSSGSDAPADADATDQGWRVAAAFYPLQYVTEAVGGDLVSVTNLTKPGAEPHDLELAPQDLAALSEADLAVYLGGFQPAVDDAVAQIVDTEVLEVSDAADLSLTIVDEDQEDGTVIDPHFWLDPMRLADVADAVAASLGRLDPPAHATFDANAAKLRSKLEQLDAEYRTGLSDCEHRQLVTSHAAFGYLADAYELDQVGLTGLTPETEPNPQDLADVTQFVRDNDVQTIFYETLVSPDVAQTVAQATGASTNVLDPIEGLSEQSQGDDYLQVMQSNLTNLREGLPCP